MGWMSEQELKKRSRKRTSNNRTTTGFRISDELWAVLQPLLPVPLNTHRFGGGRPRVPDRRCADAIFYVLRTGCQWQAGLEQFEETCGIDWQWLSMDGAMTKAPLGGEKTGPNPTDRGKSGVKRSLLTEGHGVPIGLTIEGANRHDMKLLRPTIESIIIKREDADRGPPARDVSGQRVGLRRSPRHLGRVRLYGPYSPTRRRSQSHQERSRLQSAALDGGTESFLDSALSPPARSLGQKAGELSGLASFCLWLDRFSRRRVIRIGSYHYKRYENQNTC